MDGMAELADLGAALTQWQLTDTPVCAVRRTDLHGLGVTAPAQLMLTDGHTGLACAGSATAEMIAWRAGRAPAALGAGTGRIGG